MSLSFNFIIHTFYGSVILDNSVSMFQDFKSYKKKNDRIAIFLLYIGGIHKFVKVYNFLYNFFYKSFEQVMLDACYFFDVTFLELM